MNRRLFLLPLFLLPASLFAQVDRSITVTASRNVTVAPDQAIFNIQVISATDASLDDVVAALQGVGVTAANFNSVYTTSQLIQTGKDSATREFLNWSFTITAPLSNLKATLAQLSALQIAVASKGSGMTVSYSVGGTRASPQALSGQTCAASDLITDARAQAQKMATAAGLSVGSVIGVSGTSVVTPATTGFSSGTYQPTCSITVKFALTGL